KRGWASATRCTRCNRWPEPSYHTPSAAPGTGVGRSYALRASSCREASSHSTRPSPAGRDRSAHGSAARTAHGDRPHASSAITATCVRALMIAPLPVRRFHPTAGGAAVEPVSGENVPALSRCYRGGRRRTRKGKGRTPSSRAWRDVFFRVLFGLGGLFAGALTGGLVGPR